MSALALVTGHRSWPPAAVPAACMLALAAIAAPLPAQVDTARVGVVLVGAGAADRSGLVGHAGWLGPAIRRVPVRLRVDGLYGRLSDGAVGAASVSVEVAPRLAALRDGTAGGGLFLFAAAGPAVTWRRSARDVAGMIAVGTRIGTGRIALTGEQRFQQHFSPFTIGVAFSP